MKNYIKTLISIITITSVMSLNAQIKPRAKMDIIDFSLQNSTGKYISTKNYRNSFLLIRFQNPDCLDCNIENKYLENLLARYQNAKFKITEKGFYILDVSFNKVKNKWLKQVKDDKESWDNLIDLSGLDGKLAKQYGITETTIILYDGLGKVVSVNPTAEYIEKLLEGNLKK